MYEFMFCGNRSMFDKIKWDSVIDRGGPVVGLRTIWRHGLNCGTLCARLDDIALSAQIPVTGVKSAVDILEGAGFVPMCDTVDYELYAALTADPDVMALVALKPDGWRNEVVSLAVHNLGDVRYSKSPTHREMVGRILRHYGITL